MTTPPTGQGRFQLAGVEQLTPARIRLTFTRIPAASDARLETDSLNPSNYQVVGDGAVVVCTGVAPTSGDAYSVDLQLAASLPAGSWVLQVGGIKSARQADLDGSTQVDFTTQLPSGLPNVTGGASDLTPMDILRRHLSPALHGKGWDALLAALAQGDAFQQDNNRAAFDQMFAQTATGRWLDRRGDDVGLARNPHLGMPDEVYRQLIVRTTPVQTTVQSLWDVLAAYYGEDACRAHHTSGLAEPYSLQDGWQLVVALDGADPVTVTFRSADFGSISAATALEVAESINRQLRLLGRTGWAVSFEDPDDGAKYVRIYAGARGLDGTVQIQGGEGVQAMGWPTFINLGGPATAWLVDPQVDGTSRYISAFAALNNCVAGDYLLIYGSEFAAANRGTFLIQDVQLIAGGSYVVVQNPAAQAEAVVQVGFPSIRRFRSTVYDIQDAERTCMILQDAASSLEITIPATSQAVGREEGEAAYLHAQDGLDITALSRTATTLQVTTLVAHGLQTGDWVILQGSVGETAGGVNGCFRVTGVVDPQNFTVETEQSGAVGTCWVFGQVVPVAAVQDEDAIGPYLVDPASPSISQPETTTGQAILKNQQYNLLQVASAMDFPDQSGWLVVGLGSSLQEGPVRYWGRAGSTGLLVDYSHVWQHDIPTGTNVTLVTQPAGWEPTDLDTQGLCYLTASQLGLISCRERLAACVAAGYQVDVQVTYPGDRGLGAEGAGQGGVKQSDIVHCFGVDDAN